MDDDDDKVDLQTDFSTESSWTLDATDSAYLFGSDRESSILGEFGWNLHPDHNSETASDFVDFDRIQSNFGCATTFPESSNAPVRFDGAVQVRPAENIPSISSSTSEDLPDKSKDKASKVKKKGTKRIRQPRFAFTTKSDIDNLEDGYRWRKYGQKAVKNSPFPRSYYRCTNSKCTVKKRVERSGDDPSTVVTTYEGQHCHHAAGFPRGGGGGGLMMINQSPLGASNFEPHPNNSGNYYSGITRLPHGPTLPPPQISAAQEAPAEICDRAAPQLPIYHGLLGDIVHPGGS